MVDRKWIEDEREGWRQIVLSKAPEAVREQAKKLVEVFDEVLEHRREKGI